MRDWTHVWWGRGGFYFTTDSWIITRELNNEGDMLKKRCVRGQWKRLSCWIRKSQIRQETTSPRWLSHCNCVVWVNSWLNHRNLWITETIRLQAVVWCGQSKVINTWNHWPHSRKKPTNYKETLKHNIWIWYTNTPLWLSLQNMPFSQTRQQFNWLVFVCFRSTYRASLC